MKIGFIFGALLATWLTLTYLVVDTITLEGREHPLDYMRVVATSKLAHIPKPPKGFGQSSFRQI
ncbi:hypothetical protein IGF43_004331 [Escherichia coli]|nr:hypothetical protein [Escherichia coli]EGI4598205.1 hypothetical protein [Escherichia coli]